MSEESAAAYDALVEFLYQAPIGLLQTGIDGEITMINPMAASLLMPIARDGDLSNLFDVLDPLLPQLRAMAAAQEIDGQPVGGKTLRIPLGHAAPAGSAVTTLGLRLVRIVAASWMATVIDITQAVKDEQRQIEDRLRDASRTDSLTALPNRSVAVERIGQARGVRGAGAGYAILFVNIDRFARVNTTRGQVAGDRLLRMAADRLVRLCRPGGELAAAGACDMSASRLGGDEFVMVVQGAFAGDAAQHMARSVVEALCKPYGIDQRPEHVSVSVGMVLGAAHEGDADALLQDASLAMREAKRAGGAGFRVFEPAMRLRAARHALLEADLRGAIDRGELWVAYQPIVALPQRHCVGMEALVRWQHPVLGALSPVEFIGVAEETGLIRVLGRFVLSQACQAAARWQRTLGPLAPRSMSVNVSRAQLNDAEFVEQVRQVLAETGLAARDLQLEVTESLAAQDQGVQQQLHHLRSLGVTIALDDFGTGYSSLASLHELPIDVLKIDRSFVTQVETSAHHRVLIEAVILVARSLRLRTVAEGIETEGQARALAELQCDKGQGYLFARPIPEAEMEAWLLGQACAEAA